jgi:hypothetical protein
VAITKQKFITINISSSVKKIYHTPVFPVPSNLQASKGVYKVRSLFEAIGKLVGQFLYGVKGK